ncbi:MAG TPA: ROK family transcriptional regulator [Tepiditoga sp.]|nr:ROK family transcriptional regulator [Thermotogota bacterium]HOO73873.1 ROK family transcriptional regulator [Tepiditoga sp.]
MSEILKEVEEKILKILRKTPLISRADISRESNFSKPVVSQIISKFISEGAVEEKEIGESSKKGGKKPILLSFIPDYKYIIGIDVGGNKIISVLTDLDGNIIKKYRGITKGIKTKEELTDAVKNSINQVMPEIKSKVIGIGIGVPGTTDMKSGFIYYLPAFKIKNFNLSEKINEIYSVPVIVSNDVTANAFGEMWKGAAKNSKNIFLTAIGTGTGSGIIINGDVYTGSHNMAGEFGYVITDWQNEKNDSDKTFGHLENWFSGHAIEKKVYEKFGKEVTAIDFFDDIERNNDYKKIFYDSCEHLALGISNIINLLDPEIIVITGGIGYNRYEIIIETIMKTLKETVPEEILSKISFERGKLGDLGVALGAVSLVHDILFMKL